MSNVSIAIPSWVGCSWTSSAYCLPFYQSLDSNAMEIPPMVMFHPNFRQAASTQISCSTVSCTRGRPLPASVSSRQSSLLRLHAPLPLEQLWPKILVAAPQHTREAQETRYNYSSSVRPRRITLVVFFIIITIAIIKSFLVVIIHLISHIWLKGDKAHPLVHSMDLRACYLLYNTPFTFKQQPLPSPAEHHSPWAKRAHKSTHNRVCPNRRSSGLRNAASVCCPHHAKLIQCYLSVILYIRLAPMLCISHTLHETWSDAIYLSHFARDLSRGQVCKINLTIFNIGQYDVVIFSKQTPW